MRIKRGYTSVKCSIHCWACINPQNLCQMRFSSILSAKCEALTRKCAERPPKPECWPHLRDHDCYCRVVVPVTQLRQSAEGSELPIHGSTDTLLVLVTLSVILGLLVSTKAFCVYFNSPTAPSSQREKPFHSWSNAHTQKTRNRTRTESRLLTGSRP